MARPKPTVLLEHTDQKFRSEQVLEADAIYAVFYQGQPINLKSFNSLVDYPGAKYKKTSFSNSGHAFNLAERLNTKFKTEDFTVVKLNDGEQIKERPDTRDSNLRSG
jgi:hypothetical protein